MFEFIYMCNYSSGQRKRDPEFPPYVYCSKLLGGSRNGKEDMDEIQGHSE